MSVEEHSPRDLPAGCSLYHATPGPQPLDAPRLLLITYHFPPDPLVGGLRWQHMTRHFAEQGWRTDVVTRSFDGDRSIDLSRLANLAPGTRVFSVSARAPHVVRLLAAVRPMLRGARRPVATSGAESATSGGVRESESAHPLLRAYRAWVVFAYSAIWAETAGRVATALARQRPYAAIISSGPPHMAHVAGITTGRQAGLPVVVDMRDPWSLSEHLPDELESPLWYWLARRHERRVMRDAALVTMNTDAGRDAMRALYPGVADRVTTIRNGCDDEPIPEPVRDGVFRIRFAGSIYIDRDPRLLFRAAARAIDALSLSPEQIRIELAGDVDRYAGVSTLTIAAEEGVARFVTVHASMPRRQVLEFLAGATMLLSLPQDSAYAIPAKIYEYMRVAAWLLALTSPAGPTARLLEGTNADVLDPADVDGITRTLVRRYEQFARGELPQPVGGDGRFDRRVQSAKLLRLIEGLAVPAFGG